jgi:hypothetical protein
MMKPLPLVLGLALLAASGVARGWPAADQTHFEQVQKELFAAGSAYVNAWADFDGDGDADLFVGFDGTPNRLYRNDKGQFVDAAVAAGIADARPTRAAAWGDADGDGDPDLLVGFTPVKADPAGSSDAAAGAAEASGGLPSTPTSLPSLGTGKPRPPFSNLSVLRFYRNTRGVFADETDGAGLHVATGAVRQPVWVDFDGDRDLDLFVAFRDRPNAFFRNSGGRFVEMASEVGLADPRRTLGAVWFDYDEDGDLDVVTGNMDGDANGLFRYDGTFDSGKFTDVAEAVGIAWGGRTPRDKANGTVRPCVADVNNDGRLDVFFANYGRNGLFLNRGKGKYDDVSLLWGIAIDARFDTCAFGDMDNDGNVDLYVNGTVTGGTSYRDYLFRNTGTAFQDVTPAEIGSPHGDHGAQWADYDLDGALDLALTGVQKEGMHWLLRNLRRPVSVNHALNVRVLDENGRATLAGAEVSVLINGTEVPLGKRLVDAGSGYNSQNDIPVHFGVPQVSRVYLQVRVRRPGRDFVTTSAAIDVNLWQDRVYELRLPSRPR